MRVEDRESESLRIDQDPRGAVRLRSRARDTECEQQGQARKTQKGVKALALLLGFVAQAAWGASYPLPADGGNMVGAIRVIRLDDARNTLLDIARHYDLGYNEIVAANPGVSVWLPGAGTRIVVPTEFILPPKPWNGIVINIPRRRLYYFPAPQRGEPRSVITFPIGISRPGWSTPLGRTRIIAKFKDPSWIVPKNIQEEHRREGEPRFPSYFPPGPDNPMGMLAMETGFSEIFIHGTNRPWGVGMRVSHGCLHLYPEDAAYLFARLRVGTPVRVIDEPFEVGQRAGQLYLSASPPIPEYAAADDFLTRAVSAVVDFQRGSAVKAGPADWDRLIHVAQAKQIMPTPISVGAPTQSARLDRIQETSYRVEPYGLDANDAQVPQGR